MLTALQMGDISLNVREKDKRIVDWSQLISIFKNYFDTRGKEITRHEEGLSVSFSILTAKFNNCNCIVNVFGLKLFQFFFSQTISCKKDAIIYQNGCFLCIV